MARLLISAIAIVSIVLCTISVSAELIDGFRPPAVPLFMLSPTIHAWTRGSNLTDDAPSHWFNGQNSTMTAYARIDGAAYRFLGIDKVSSNFAFFLNGNASTEQTGKDLPNQPIMLAANAAPRDCALLCAMNTSCFAWSFFPNNNNGGCNVSSGSLCFLKAAGSVQRPNSCATSGTAQVYFNQSFLDGVANLDTPGGDLTDFSFGGAASDCSLACMANTQCRQWTFAPSNCGYGPQPHCWLKGLGTTAPYTTNCRTSGSSVYSLGWQSPGLATVTPMQQTRLRVQPTQTIATFVAAGVQLTLTFTQPSFPADLPSYARQHAYINVDVASIDGSSHSVQVYFDAATDFVINDENDQVVWSDLSNAVRDVLPNAHVLTQSVYAPIAFTVRGDTNRPNHGRAYIATDSQYYSGSTQTIAKAARSAFFSNQPLPPTDINQPRSSGEFDMTVSAYTFDFGTIMVDQTQSACIVYFYDELFSIYYFQEYLQPYWKRLYGTFDKYLIAAIQDYSQIKATADAYDAALIADMSDLVGEEFTTLLALIHRQVMGSTLVVWNEAKQSPWVFMKEMSTGGAISTIDVVYPAAPFYIALAPEALRLTLLSFLSYCNNETVSKYTLPWAAHHLGAWPVCDILSFEQEQMPVEESANMLIMFAAIAQRQNGQVDYLQPYSNLLFTWASFINSSLPDPGNQLCTDDFEGPSPHNANLALKGIIGLNAYAVLLRYFNDDKNAEMWDTLATQYAQDWMKLAIDTTSDLQHYKQAYDQPGTWSTKYNLIWQYALGTTAFPDSVRMIENKYYQSKRQTYGIPLDNRHIYAKCDWFSWMGALAFDNSTQQNYIKTSLYNFAHTSPSRQPFTDYFDTTANIAGSDGFIARAVMGGLYSIPILNAIASHNTLDTIGLESIGDRFDYLKHFKQKQKQESASQ